jgi:hypothetical protein
LAAFFLCFGLFSMGGQSLSTVRIPFALLLSAIVLTALHLLPLPPAVYTSLPGRELAASALAVVGGAQDWMPFTLDPFAGWNTLLSFVVPLTAMVLMVRAGPQASTALLRLLVIIVIGSALLGMIQVIGPPGSPLYFYRITNADTAVGLFANRNHHAFFLATGFPLLAMWASLRSGSPEQIGRRQLTAIAFGLAVLVVLIVTGSRQGLLLGFIGFAGAAMIYSRPEVKQRRRHVRPMPGWAKVGLAAVPAILLLIVFASGRGLAFERLMDVADACPGDSGLFAVGVGCGVVRRCLSGV